MMRRNQRDKKQAIKRDCTFCKVGTCPYYGQPEVLSAFLSDRGKILNRARSGVCAPHQRRLVVAIKRARVLALLPFLTQV